MRVLHAPVNVGNQPWVLSRHERELGLQSDLLVNYSTWLDYPADKIISKLSNRSITHRIKRSWTGFSAPLRYDVLHYYFGRSLLNWDDYGPTAGFPFLDLKMAKKLGKKIFFTLQGCDSRLAEESNRRNEFTPCQEGRCAAYNTCLESLDNERRHLIKKILPLCDQIFFLNPELGHFIGRGTFLPYSNVDVERMEFDPPQMRDRPVILHAPSNPQLKGTTEIIEAVESLKTNFDFEFKLIQGLPHAEAMRLYKEADLVIDQGLYGWYGGFAVELMAMGKPVMAYLRKEDFGFVPDGMIRDLPILNFTIKTLKDELAKLLTNPSQWKQLGKQSREFALKWHNPKKIAAAMVELYKDPTKKFSIEDKN